jgi:hypothetical protein
MPAINNPTNSFTIQKTKSEIFDAVKRIASTEKQKYKVVSHDDILNRISLREAAIIGNNGYNIEFILTKISENEFTVKVETSRERGGLDTPTEINNANYILKEVTDKFSSYLSGNVNEKGEAIIPDRGTGCILVLGIMIITVAGIAVLHMT